MILEDEFFSGSHLRWNLGWPTPNYAGAFLVSVLALCWIFSNSRWRWVALAAEAGGLFLLAKTYSRGAVVAWGAAWLFGVAASRGWKVPAERPLWAARLGVLAIMMLAAGFGWSRAAENEKEMIKHGTSTGDGRAGEDANGIERKAEAAHTKDGSVINRLALWRGGLQMIAASPWNGWGAGESCRAYMNWYQDLDRDEGYATMVNTYLHVAVERGLPILAGVLWIAAWFILTAWRGARDDTGRPEARERLGERETRTIQRMFSTAAGASLVGWLVANAFTTLWIEPKLWIVPSLAGLALIWNARMRPAVHFVSLAGICLVIAVCAIGGLYGAGRLLAGKLSIVSFPGINGSVGLALTGTVGAVWHAWPDPLVLGATPGKELRRWLDIGTAPIRLVAHRAAPLQSGEVSRGAEGVLLFGRHVERIGNGFEPDCRELWLVHPTVSPPAALKWSKKTSPAITVVLPQIDETGNGPAWRHWAQQNGARVVESPACALDIRAVWPAILNQGKEVGMAANIIDRKNGVRTVP